MPTVTAPEIVRPTSPKLRALQSATGKSLAALVTEWAPSPLSQTEIAAKWTELVDAVFPELGIRFTRDDVYRVFRHQGVRAEKVGA